MTTTGAARTGGPHTAASRRRERGSDSARSLLLTVLGEFVHPRGEPVWTSTLVRALAELAVEEKAARQAIARTGAEGVLHSEREGRRVRWVLTEPGRRLLAEGTERIYGFLATARPWDGRWLVLSVAIPETQRQLRHRLRTRLSWLGMGSPSPGLWVVPDAGRAAAVAEVVAEVGVSDRAFAWVGETTPLGEPGALIAAAWSLAEVSARYTEFLDGVAATVVGDDAETFTAQVQLVQAWRRFPFLDPALPSELLEPDWPGAAAAAAFRSRHAAWGPGAQRHWDTSITRAP